MASRRARWRAVAARAYSRTQGSDSPVRRRHRERGQAVAELALTAPFLFVLLLAAVDVGRLFSTYIGIQNAAREGAAFGALHPTCWSAPPAVNGCPDPANITYVARQELGGDQGLTVSVSCATACVSTTAVAANTITVTATRPFNLLVPNFILPNLTIRASVTAVIQ